jgi:hypothetical protein
VLVWFSLPDVVRALAPAVCASLVDAAFAFDSVKHSTFAYNLAPPIELNVCNYASCDGRVFTRSQLDVDGGLDESVTPRLELNL